jgi:hypothetical protein
MILEIFTETRRLAEKMAQRNSLPDKKDISITIPYRYFLETLYCGKQWLTARNPSKVHTYLGCLDSTGFHSSMM